MGGEEVYFTEAHVESGNKQLMEYIGEVTHQLTNTPYADASPLSSREAIRMGYATKESMHANSHYYAAGAILWKIIILTWTMLLSLNSLPLQHPILTV